MSETNVIGCALEWLEARTGVLSEPAADVRKSEMLRAAMDRLANAEDNLAKAVRKLPQPFHSLSRNEDTSAVRPEDDK